MSHPPQFQCKHCQKPFSRNDLMIRHQRRCNTSVRVSKQKACAACVRTKSRCSLTQPICHRCASRAEACEYPNSSSAPTSIANSEEHGILSAQAGTLALDWNSDIPMIYDDFWLQIDETTPGADVMRFQPEINIDILHKDLAQAPETQAFATEQIRQSVDANTLRHNSISGSLSASTNHFHNLSLSKSDNSGSQTSRTISSSWAPSISPNAEKGLPTRHEIQSRPPSSIHGSIRSSRSSSIVAHPTFGYSSLAHIIKSYFQLLQTESYHSPFIHPELLQGPHQNMSSLQKSSMAICSGVALQDKRSRYFAKNAISAERDRLVHEFHSYSCVEEWDALHAVCIYQIISLLEVDQDVAWKSGVNSSWLHIPFLLKMARRFRDNHLHSMSWDSPEMEVTNNETKNWREWIVDETVRRTVFLVHCINEATCYSKDGKRTTYYEPLDQDYILNMVLPAPTPVWEASTSEAWAAQKDECGWSDGSVTLRSFLSGESDLEARYGGQPGVCNSKELADLVIACGHLAGLGK
ncbi:hypothetical protein B0O99DRAFT_590445 [Bisporella sp. PMI_857]|nr:hypothetical protein B0O99DRAFT_590445 [Bisporella sp. PMI_857]